MRSMVLGRRMRGDPLNYRDGYLLPTGAFVFADGGVWKILTQTELGHFRAMAGDPRVVAGSTNRLHMNFSQSSGDQDIFLFKGGIFERRLTKPTETMITDYHPVQKNRVWRHYSDTLAANVQLDDMNFRMYDGDFYQVMRLNEQNAEFEFNAINPGTGNVYGDFSKVLDTYFGGVIGLKDHVLIGQRHRSQPRGIIANLWDGSTLYPVGQPPYAFFEAIFGQIANGWYVRNMSLTRAKPLCRVGDNEAACTGEAGLSLDGNFNFPGDRGFHWIFGYLKCNYTVLNPIPFWVLDQGPSEGLDPSPYDVGMDCKVPEPLRLRCSWSGSADVVFGLRSGSFTSPTVTRIHGNFNTLNVYHRGLPVWPQQAGVRGDPFRLMKRKNGPYELWREGDPGTPSFDSELYEEFTCRWRNGVSRKVQSRGVSHTLNTSADPSSPYPSDSGSEYWYGERVRAAVPYNGGLLVMSVAGDGARIGPLGRTYPSPFGLLQRQPRVAGPFIFAEGHVSLDGGATWQRHDHVWGAGYTSAGARTLEWRFGLTKEELENAVPVI